MTGRHPIRYGMMRGVVMGYHDYGLDPEATLIPQVLAEAGYEQRGLVGKWHLAIVGEGVPPEKYEWFGGHAMSRARLEDVEGRLSNRRIAGAKVHSMDVGIGRILDALDEAGVADDTLVWFFSDNGGATGIGEVRPFRGSKANVFEGGIRVVAAARWPAGGVSGGGAISAPLNYLDVMPTLMEAAAASDRFDLDLDGREGFVAPKRWQLAE